MSKNVAKQTSSTSVQMVRNAERAQKGESLKICKLDTKHRHPRHQYNKMVGNDKTPHKGDLLKYAKKTKTQDIIATGTDLFVTKHPQPQPDTLYITNPNNNNQYNYRHHYEKPTSSDPKKRRQKRTQFRQQANSRINSDC